MADWAQFSRRSLIFAGASSWLVPAVGACASARADLRPPFAAFPPAKLVKLDRAVDTPEPVISLSGDSRYVRDDPARADVDPDAAEAYERAVAPLRSFEREVVRHANRYVRSRGQTPAHAARAGGMLWRWAKADALDEMKSDTAHFNRSASVAAMSLAWMQVREAIDPDDDGRRDIEKWFDRRGDEVRDFYDEKDPEQRSARNNHRYWAGLAAAGAGVAAGSTRLLDWGLDSGELGLRQVDRDGALPLELSRGKRALYYHAYALGPLTMLAEIGARNGRSLYDVHGGALHRLVRFTLAGIENPERIAQRAGAEQEPLGRNGGPFDAGDVAWLEIYDARYRDRNPWMRRMTELRPLTLTRLGGDLTLLFSGQNTRA
ncbi:alginate lyase family protein [Phenylobacterium sp.]|jgi:poly(beta-D-mannuronate) lyase|uniref:alginate lyase family protein n=1 Tax=Phenylobacterium sp. TaxID=1871053 RepID=UPI002E382298|nr:alginate lyase family protein [Phenylobacterium sp.]HEX2559475.1 alginate lyase family protein [Phenylobacterium sp.]